MTSYKESFLSLVRMGIGHRADTLTHIVDWSEMKVLAEKQGLSAIVLDGIERLPEQIRPPKKFLLEWIGITLQGYEYRYEQYQRTIAEMARFYNSHGYKMMVPKGYACSLEWPKPEHRPCGDVDVWLFGNQKEADAALEKEKFIEIDKKHEHHTVFYWNDFMVENHYDFINTRRHKSHYDLEGIFKELGADESHYCELYGEKVYLPSPNLHALFLVRHILKHFAAVEISLRQVLDWAFFVEKHSKEIDWNWLDEMLDKYNMKDFYGCLNAICVEDLGFDACLFNEVQFIPSIKAKVLDDILFPRYPLAEPKGFLRKYAYKYRRWKGNEWKHRLCYKESRRTEFWQGIRAHVFKPSDV